jgi:hypothetical protein
VQSSGHIGVRNRSSADDATAQKATGDDNLSETGHVRAELDRVGVTYAKGFMPPIGRTQSGEAR